MPYPTKYTRQYDFQSYQNANPNRPLPGDKVNFDLNAVVISNGQTIDFLKQIARSDGKIANASIGFDQLTVDVKAYFGGIGLSGNLAALDALAGDGVVRRSTDAGISYTAGGAISVAEGGTGADTEAAARIALGVEIGADVQAYSENLDAFAEVAPSAVALELLADETAADMLTTLEAVAKSGGTMTGVLTLSGDPSSALHAATKQYVDNTVAGLDPKPSVACATTANITLSGEQTIDGITTSESRVLVKDQTAAEENGIYVSGADAWARAADMDAWAEVLGASVLVEAGTANANSGWIASAAADGELGTDDITWAQFFGTGIFQPSNARLADLAGITYAQGDVLYFDGTNLVKLAAGSSGQFLKTLGTGANPAWASIPGGGDMLSTNNLSDVGSADTSLDNLGGTTVGKAVFTATDAAAARTALEIVPGLPSGYLYGLTLANNATDATNDIDIAVGKCRSDDDDDDLVLSSALTKRLDAAWAVGSGNGGLDTGTIANTTYHVWLIRRSDTGIVDSLFSASATSPTMPTNYDAKRRIGAVLRESGAIVLFAQSGDKFLRTSSALDLNVSVGTTATLATLSVPVGIKVDALIRANMVNSGSAFAGLITSPDETDQAPSSTNANFRGVTTNPSAIDAAVRVNASAQVRCRSNASSTTTVISTYGWIDSRGR